MNGRRTSMIWKFFSVSDANRHGNKQIAECNICKKYVSYSTTSNLKKHMNRKHPTMREFHENVQKRSDNEDNKDADTKPDVPNYTSLTASGQEEEQENGESIHNEYSNSQFELVEIINEACENEEVIDNSHSPPVATRKVIPKKTYEKQTTNVSKQQQQQQPNQQSTLTNLVAGKLLSQNKFANYGVYVGQELQELPPQMALFCQKIINDALYYANSGQLTENSRLIIDNS